MITANLSYTEKVTLINKHIPEDHPLVKVFQMLSMYPNTSVSLTLHAVEFDTEGSLFQLYLV